MACAGSFGSLALCAIFCSALDVSKGSAAQVTNLPPVLPPPEFLANKAPLPDLLLKDKRANRYITGFPVIGWDPQTGLNYGAAVQWFDNGPTDSPFFRYTPYKQRLAVTAAGSSGGSSRA